MKEIDFRVVRFALFSRFLTIFMQVFANLFVPDHDAEVFLTPSSYNSTVIDHIASYFFDGFARWDAQYFLHVARYGYTYENSLAFFPLFPLSVQFFKFVFFIFFEQHDYYCLLFIGLILNTLFFCISALFFYKLSSLILKSKEMALIASLLFCINPSSIFFSAFYSESLFCMLTLVGLYYLECKRTLLAVIYLGLSAATRSNGIISYGFVLHCLVQPFIKKCLHVNKNNICYFFMDSFLFAVRTLLSFIVFIIPFSVYQAYAYLLYCTSYIKVENIVDAVKDYGSLNNFKGPGDPRSDWCNWTMPLSYPYVQSQYWNVGFLRYYQFKQIPNFLLAAPAVLIILYGSIKYFQLNGKLTLNLGLLAAKKSANYLFRNEKCFIYIAHAFILTIFCIFFIHIQVTTRLLSSSSPVLYWIVAFLVNAEKDSIKTIFLVRTSALGDLLLLHSLMQSNLLAKMCFNYFMIYYTVGTMIHVNNLPWT